MILEKSKLKHLFMPLFICAIFFILYSILSIVRHNHYQSFGYDLGINDQIVWEYSKFLPPISTIGPNPSSLKLVNHVEIVFAIIAPFYWVYSSPITLLLLQSLFFSASGMAIYLLAKNQGLNKFLLFFILISYLMFYGVQNAIWFDVHSISFGASFLAWFLYFYQTRKNKLTILFFLLTIASKENFSFIIFFIGVVYFLQRKDKLSAFIILSSAIYTIFIFFVFFPHILHVSYQYQNKAGLLSNLNLLSFFDSKEKLRVIFYTLASFGFIPLLNPLVLIPMLADLSEYFVIGSELTGAQGLYMQYRISLAPLMAWATILTIYRFKFLNTKWTAIYILLSIMLVQYVLHLPLSYLSKQWFWTQPKSEAAINDVIKNYLPKDASVVSQNNITPHISQRLKIYTLFPTTKEFVQNSPCGYKVCDWFRWAGNPQYLIVDTSKDWDIRHMLANNKDFIAGLKNLEKKKIIKIYKQEKTTVLYRVLQNP